MSQRIRTDFRNYYEIIGEQPIGKGAFGFVYKGKEKKTNELRAIKIIQLDDIRNILLNELESDEIEVKLNSYIKDYIQEFELMKICCENNINSVKCYEYFNNRQFFVIIMELCDSNLSQLLIDKYKRDKTGFNIDEIYEIMIQLNNAFNKMRNNRIIHRDLKLENILIKYDRRNQKKIIKLADYGSGRILNSLNSSNYIYSNKGTVIYMAPELLKEQKYNYKCDLWSIGIIIYKLRFFNSPFPGENSIALIRFIDKFGNNIFKKDKNEDFNNLIKSLLEKNIQKRFNWDQYFNHPFFLNKKTNNLYYNSKNGLFTQEKKSSIYDYFPQAKGRLSEISGILYLFFLKFISNKIQNERNINKDEIRNIINKLKYGSELNLNEISRIRSNNNIIAYLDYINLIIDEKEINYLIEFLDLNQQKEILELWRILYKFKDLNKIFEENFMSELENSYFDYSLIDVSINIQTNIFNFINELNRCNNYIMKSLFHGTKNEIVLKILKQGYLYSKRTFFGMGVYFTNMLDYVLFYSYKNSVENKRENWGKIIPVGNTFSCVGNIVFYDNNKKKNIYDGKYKEEINEHLTYEEIKQKYPDKMIQKNGIHISKIELINGRLLDKDEIIENQKLDNILGIDYAITEMSQILPLYGLTFQRNEFLVIWKNCLYKNTYYKEYNITLQKIKFFVNEYKSINIYFKNNIDAAYELVKRKKFNKIILISDIDNNLSEINYIRQVRKIIGFPIMILFMTNNKSLIDHIKVMSNVLFSDDINFCLKYILNYTEDGLYSLKTEVERKYNIILNYTYDFLSFSNFIHSGKYDKIYYNRLSSNKIYLKPIEESKNDEPQVGDNKIIYKNA